MGNWGGVWVNTTREHYLERSKERAGGREDEEKCDTTNKFQRLLHSYTENKKCDMVTISAKIG